jgi:hypothetical protein
MTSDSDVNVLAKPVRWPDIVAAAQAVEELFVGEESPMMHYAIADLLVAIDRYDQQQEDLQAKLTRLAMKYMYI